MVTKERKLYVGYDLNDNYSQISYWEEGLEEPVSISTVTGKENFLIPTIVCKKMGIGQWFYGEEARKCHLAGEGIIIENLIKRSIAGEMLEIEGENYSLFSFLELFVKKTVNLISTVASIGDIKNLTFTCDNLNKETVEILNKIAESLPIDRGNIRFQDYKESFYYYILNQKSELRNHEVALFDYRNDVMNRYFLRVNNKTTPRVVIVENKVFDNIPSGDLLQKDIEFAKIVNDEFNGKIVSCVYLTGADFNGDWMKMSLKALCKTRKAFMGQNLFAEGACYQSKMFGLDIKWDYTYLGDFKMKSNIGLCVYDKGNERYYSLISAGENWYESGGSCDVILDGVNSIGFILNSVIEHKEHVEIVELEGLLKRPEKTTRIRIKATTISDCQIEMKMTDMGFGDLFKGTFKEWKYTINL